MVVVDEVREVARKQGFTVVTKPFKLDAQKKVTADGAPEMIRELKEQRVDWLYLPPDSFLGTQAQKIIIPAAMEHQLPTFASTEQLVEAGALIGLVSLLPLVGQFTASGRAVLVRSCPPRASLWNPHRAFPACAWRWPRRWLPPPLLFQLRGVHSSAARGCRRAPGASAFPTGRHQAVGRGRFSAG